MRSPHWGHGEDMKTGIAILNFGRCLLWRWKERILVTFEGETKDFLSPWTISEATLSATQPKFSPIRLPPSPEVALIMWRYEIMRMWRYENIRIKGHADRRIYVDMQTWGHEDTCEDKDLILLPGQSDSNHTQSRKPVQKHRASKI